MAMTPEEFLEFRKSLPFQPDNNVQFLVNTPAMTKSVAILIKHYLELGLPGHLEVADRMQEEIDSDSGKTTSFTLKVDNDLDRLKEFVDWVQGKEQED